MDCDFAFGFQKNIVAIQNLEIILISFDNEVLDDYNLPKQSQILNVEFESGILMLVFKDNSFMLFEIE